jgi:2-oxoglutarate ferredoxin oxidoreductase subunit gamma
MTEELIISGFGGQGVMLMGQLIAYAGMLENKNVSWIPSYGPEMRGGTANCSIIVSDQPIGTPIVTEPTTVVVMNLPSLDKFESTMKAGGNLISNSSLVACNAKRNDINYYEIPANDIANNLGNSKVANMVILGSLIAATRVVSTESVITAFAKMFARKPNLLKVNEQALRHGVQYIQ